MGATLPKTVAFHREHTGDLPTSRAQELAQRVRVAHEQTKAVVAANQATMLANQAAAATNQAASIAPNGGQFLSNVTISTAGTSLAHTLGRVPVGYVITRVRGLSTGAPYTVGDNGAHTTTALNLLARCSTGGAQTITVDLYVF